MKSTVIIAVAIGVLVALGVAMIIFWRPRKEQGYVVLGEELAKAQVAEEARKRKGGTENSPMPAGEYDRWRGEESLVNPTKNSFDSELSDLCRKFATSDSKTRTAMRNAISMDEFYTLLTFSKRAAVFAIHQISLQWLESDENPAPESVLKRVRGSASILGYLQPNEHPSHDGHVLMLFLVETEDSRSAQELLAMSKRKRPDDYSMLGVSEGRLFCLVIGRSIDQGVTSFETPEKFQRFAAPVAEVLKRFAASS